MYTTINNSTTVHVFIYNQSATARTAVPHWYVSNRGCNDVAMMLQHQMVRVPGVAAGGRGSRLLAYYVTQ